MPSSSQNSELRKPPEEGERVLVVDDAPQNVALMQAILTLAGYEVVTARDGEEALEKVQREPPDLILIDATVPKLNGYEVCTRLKGDERTRLLPIVLITNWPEEEIRAIEAGCNGFLTRPFSRVELLAWVRSLIRTKRLHDNLIDIESAILALARSVEAKDPYNEGHIERIVTYVSSLGKELGLSQRAQDELRRGAIVHDVGKIGVRDSVLLKPGPLTAEEFEEVKTHPVVGARICQPLRVKSILDVVRHHHERYDGKGYPDGLAGEDIPLVARIMAVADAYDAITSDRPHRKRLPEKEALRILGEEAGRQFDPRLASIFLSLVETERLGR